MFISITFPSFMVFQKATVASIVGSQLIKEKPGRRAIDNKHNREAIVRNTLGVAKPSYEENGMHLQLLQTRSLEVLLSTFHCHSPPPGVHTCNNTLMEEFVVSSFFRSPSILPPKLSFQNIRLILLHPSSEPLTVCLVDAV